MPADVRRLLNVEAAVSIQDSGNEEQRRVCGNGTPAADDFVVFAVSRTTVRTLKYRAIIPYHSSSLSFGGRSHCAEYED